MASESFFDTDVVREACGAGRWIEDVVRKTVNNLPALGISSALEAE
jgi:hypothetical protein